MSFYFSVFLCAFAIKVCFEVNIYYKVAILYSSFLFYKLSSFCFFVNFTFLLTLCEFFVFLFLWTICQFQFSLFPIIILFSFVLKFICGSDNNGISSLKYIYIYIYITVFFSCLFVYNIFKLVLCACVCKFWKWFMLMWNVCIWWRFFWRFYRTNKEWT
jgi:hypothetical protein